MLTAIQLADALGRKKIADSLGVLPTAVSNAVVRGWFPSSWFLAMARLAEEGGVECPPGLFNMREAHPPAPVAAAPADQGALAKRGGGSA